LIRRTIPVTTSATPMINSGTANLSTPQANRPNPTSWTHRPHGILQVCQ
jgi:hypothetical protein